MRQYEKCDCVEYAKRGQNLRVGISWISISPGCEVDYVAVFGNPETHKVVWVPFGSRIKIENGEYEIIEGEKYAGKRYCKTQEYTLPWWMSRAKISVGEYDHSSQCLLDKNKKLHNLEEFMDKEVVVLK